MSQPTAGDTDGNNDNSHILVTVLTCVVSRKGCTVTETRQESNHITFTQEFVNQLDHNGQTARGRRL